MMYKVNGNCVGCGQCAEICPNVFSMSTFGFAKAICADVDEADLDTAEEAMNNCPAEAIEEQ